MVDGKHNVMFQSIKYLRHLGYNAATKLNNSYEFELTDSDFTCIVVVGADILVAAVGAVIREYGKRNLNVAANLLLYFRWCEKEYGNSIAEQINWAGRNQLLFTPELKEQLQKYMVLL
jgi:hypothetical protein